MKTQHYVLIAVAALLLWYLFWYKKDLSVSAASSGASASGGGASSASTAADKAASDIAAKTSAQAQAAFAARSFPAQIPVKGPSVAKWYSNRKAAVYAAKNSGCTFVEGTGAYAGQFGCF